MNTAGETTVMLQNQIITLKNKNGHNPVTYEYAGGCFKLNGRVFPWER